MTLFLTSITFEKFFSYGASEVLFVLIYLNPVNQVKLYLLEKYVKKKIKKYSINFKKAVVKRSKLQFYGTHFLFTYVVYLFQC